MSKPAPQTPKVGTLRTRAGRTYRASLDPLANWGVLQSRISKLSAERLEKLLELEATGAKRQVVLRALGGRLNMLRARKAGRARPTRLEAQTTLEKYGVKLRNGQNKSSSDGGL